MLDFFSRGSRNKSDPLANAAAAKAYADTLKQEYGAAAHERITEMLAEVNALSPHVTADLLDAVLTLNLEIQPLHDNLCTQYFMNSRMPKVLEGQLRSQILAYGKQFLEFYQRALSIDTDMQQEERIRAMLPLVLVRMMHFFGEFARWQYLRHFSPDDVFWLNVNQLYRLAEQRRIDSTPVFLFGEDSPGTTVQDQYLIMLMLSLLSSGNLSLRQFNFSYQLLCLVSNRMSLHPQYDEDASFAVTLAEAKPAARANPSFVSESARFWSTANMVEIIHSWATVMEGGRVPPEIKPLIEPGIDAGLLHTLCREWSAKPMRFERAERVAVTNRNLEVAHRLSTLHRLIRQPDEAIQAQARHTDNDSFDDAANIRIYGFVTSRKRDRSTLALAPLAMTGDAAPAAQPLRDEFLRWSVENVSQSGLGVTLDSLGNEWVTLGSLVGYRDVDSANWSLGLVRRVKRANQRERIYLGVETLCTRPVAASIRPTDSKLIDPTLPPDMVWLAGHIALFVPFDRGGRRINALIMPISVYTLGRQYYMTARGKHFQIALGKVLEKGSDWCLAEIELVKALDKLPLAM
ncbi:hypothetical protein EAY64_13385 [Aquitalea palustris]|uniref:PilZ domain-containing protein n=1 Tax=Aquitalea palustris TaxID=2480983 RepID=A0A454JGH8_9NEIS|nr:hypothetical protein EAY64_13385 [Aquitalea palustris]